MFNNSYISEINNKSHNLCVMYWLPLNHSPSSLNFLYIARNCMDSLRNIVLICGNKN